MYMTSCFCFTSECKGVNCDQQLQPGIVKLSENLKEDNLNDSTAISVKCRHCSQHFLLKNISRHEVRCSVNENSNKQITVAEDTNKRKHCI